MTTDLRALVEKWRAENGDYPESKRDCADELQAALDAQSAQSAYNPGETLSNGAQAGMVCVGWEELLSFGYRGAKWVRIGHVGPDWTPPTGRPADKYRRIYAGPVEGGEE